MIMNGKAMYKIGYGLYVLTAVKGEKKNGCIINTAIQVTSIPNCIAITVNKENLTHDLIRETGIFNISVISRKATFDLFRHFGFQSGKTTDKFADYKETEMADNGVPYIKEATNAYISGKVKQEVDLGTHTMFIADVTAAEVLSDEPTATYDYYQSDIKPKPEVKDQTGKEHKGYRCNICGYVYEGETLPEDFVCPLCKHGASDFEKIQ